MASPSLGLMPNMLYLTSLLYLSHLILSIRAAPEVRLGRTTIVGRDILESNVHFFGGIPFAEPPAGKLRFKSPVLKTRLDGQTFNATGYGRSCIQPVSPDLSDLGMSEDCLTINIYRPAGMKRNEKLPVLFWIYGGGFIVGSSSAYDGSEIVAHSVRRGTPVVYVNFNYRVGPFGFPAGKEAEDKRKLNLGLQDVIAALKWVNANIDTFGGDKDKVTVFGESAGAVATAVLYFNRDFERLVRGAIIESGTSNGLPIFSASDREGRWQKFVSVVPSCSSIATSGNVFPCLQSVSEAEISAAYLSTFESGVDPILMPWLPIIDGGGGSLPDFPSKLYQQGKFAKIPYIIGTNVDEGTFFARAARQPGMTEEILRATLVEAVSPPLDEARLNSSINRLLELYPDVPALGSPYGTGDELFGLPSAFKQLSSILGDMMFQAPRRQWMDAASKHGVKSYGYLFTQPQPLGDPSMGVGHGSEFLFVYGTPLDPSPSARRLSTSMLNYWISFAVTLDPNDKKGAQRPIWPRYTGSNKVLLQLNGDNITTIPDEYREEQIAFFIANSLSLRR
ncbi:triacylglycerol lipase 3 [Coprinopsis marcescibilis]|uniref:Carboxylic ester hydrolase n=1 Tax=Coprinopsis marcescibilis TaxID=230819 RepID=A0A5C3KYG0_COPMA|nr:triacylglycerol lipase 3 [Coprinopsis marcescibilis]